MTETNIVTVKYVKIVLVQQTLSHKYSLHFVIFFIIVLFEHYNCIQLFNHHALNLNMVVWSIKTEWDFILLH